MTFDLGDLLKEPQPVNTREFIASTIYRLAARRKDWNTGERVLAVLFRPHTRRASREVAIRVRWDLGEMAREYGYHQVREDLRKLARTKSEDVITEQAALGTGFAVVTSLLPDDTITRVVPKGGRGDFYLNSRRDQMVEISGTMRGNLNVLFNRKKAQVLLNETLRRAIVSVSRFESADSRLERVK